MGVWSRGSRVMGAATLLAVAGCTGDATPSAGPTSTATSPPSNAAAGWPPVGNGLQVGDHPYVSACQVLTQADVAAVLDPVPPGLVAEETFYDDDIPAPGPQQWVETTCRYDESETWLVVKQYASAEAARRVWRSVGYRDQASVPDVRRNLRRTAQEVAADPTLTEFVDELLAALTAAPTVRGAEVEQLAFPVPGEKIGGLGVVVVHDNVVVTIHRGRGLAPAPRAAGTMGGGPPYGAIDPPRAEGLVEDLRILAALTRTARDRLADPGLSQEPAPLVPAAAGWGDRALVEPCAVLDRDLAAQLLAAPVGGVVARRTLPESPSSRGRITRTSGEQHQPASWCERRLEDVEGSVRLTVRSHASPEALRQAMDDEAIVEDEFDRVGYYSDADWALRIDAQGTFHLVFGIDANQFELRLDPPVPHAYTDESKAAEAELINLVVAQVRQLA